MRLPRFYYPFQLSQGASIALPESVAHHAIRVLRIKKNEALVLFDGYGGEYIANVLKIELHQTTVLVGEKRAIERESPLQVTLVQALQSGEKMDMTIQKSVELGVSKVIPVISARSVLKIDKERAQKRLLHWQAIAISACEQCGRNQIPLISPVVPLEKWLTTANETKTCRLMLNPQADTSFSDYYAYPSNIPIELLVGAEGGLSPEEISIAESAGFLSVSLGPRILRTETAGLGALAIIQYLWGDLR